MSAAFLVVDLVFVLVFFATVPAFLSLVFAEAVLLATFFFTTFLTAAFFLPVFRVTAFFCAVFFAERCCALLAARAGFLAAFLATFLPVAGRRVDVLGAAFLCDRFGAVFAPVFLTAFFAAIVRASKLFSRNGRLYIRLGSEEASGSQISRRLISRVAV